MTTKFDQNLGYLESLAGCVSGSALGVTLDGSQSVSLDGTSEVSFADDGHLDAFGRLRVSSPRTIFSFSAQYDKGPLIWAEKTAGTASITHQPDESAVDLTIGTASGDRIVRQTIQYHRYQPGKSQFIKATGAFQTAQVNTTKLIGYGDDENGIFFGQDGTGVFVLLRSNVTGTVSDSRKVYQSNWNKDPMDGTGSSGRTVDFTKACIYAIDIEWLGVGRVRCALVIEGKIFVVHEFYNAGLNSTTYMTTANLPVRYEIVNTDTAVSGAALKQICCEVESEGGVDADVVFPFSAAVTSVSLGDGVANQLPIIALRMNTAFNGVTNRGMFLPGELSIIANSGTAIGTLLYNPTITGGAWSSVNGSSFMEINTTGTAISGGIPIKHLLAASGSGPRDSGSTMSASMAGNLPFGLDVDGANPTVLALAVYGIGTGITAEAFLSWSEVR